MLTCIAYLADAVHECPALGFKGGDSFAALYEDAVLHWAEYTARTAHLHSAMEYERVYDYDPEETYQATNAVVAALLRDLALEVEQGKL